MEQWKTWIDQKLVKGKTWEEIRLGCKESEDALQEFLGNS